MHPCHIAHSIDVFAKRLVPVSHIYKTCGIEERLPPGGCVLITRCVVIEGLIPNGIVVEPLLLRSAYAPFAVFRFPTVFAKSARTHWQYFLTSNRAIQRTKADSGIGEGLVFASNAS